VKANILEVSPPLVLVGGSQGTGGGALANHELPNQESVDRHPLFYINKMCSLFFPHSSLLSLKRVGCFSYLIFYRNNVFQQSDNITVQDGQKVHSILGSLSLLPYKP